jgi:tetratricopeptide (TPR) repeat protein
MILLQQRAVLALVVAAAFLGGCSGMWEGARPVIAMDGNRMDVQDPVGNGRALLVTGQYGLAIDALSRAVHDDPGNVRALNLMAEAYARLHRYDLADRYHAEALEIDPNSVAALNNWGFSLLVRGDKARAIELLRRAEAVKGDQPVVMANLRLAGEDATAASTAPIAGPPVGDGATEVSLGRHVILVRKTAVLVRMAPGVQWLLTTAPVARRGQPALRETAGRGASDSAPFPYIVMRQEPAAVDSRIKNLAALQQLLDPSPFAVFRDVDDFNLASGLGMGSAVTSHQSSVPSRQWPTS